MSNNAPIVQLIAQRTMKLLVDLNAVLPGESPVFWAWPREERLVLVLDPERVKIGKVLSPAFKHDLSTRLSGRKVVTTNTKGIYLQVAYSPKPAKNYKVEHLDLTSQPAPLYVPVGYTENGPVWLNLLEMDSVLVGGSRRMGKTRFLHGWIQALLHGGKCEVYLWDGKGGMEFRRYASSDRVVYDDDLGKLIYRINIQREKRREILTAADVTSVPEFNEIAGPGDQMLYTVLIVDEVADVEEEIKPMLSELIGRAGAFGVYPVVATTYPEATKVQSFLKANISTRFCFPVPSHVESKVILNRSGAEKLPKTKGRLLFVWNARAIEAQSFYVDLPKTALQVVTPRMLDDEQALVEAALGNDGKLTVEMIMTVSHATKHAASRLQDDWRARGWLEKSTQSKNAHVLTQLVLSIYARRANFSETSETPETPETSETVGNRYCEVRLK